MVQGIQDLRVKMIGRIRVLLELTAWWGSQVITLTCMMSVIQLLGNIEQRDSTCLGSPERLLINVMLTHIDCDLQELMQRVNGGKEEGSCCTRDWELDQCDFCTRLQNTMQRMREKLRFEGYTQMTSLYKPGCCKIIRKYAGIFFFSSYFWTIACFNRQPNSNLM